jgi:two-component sensor histidine kinase
MMVGIMVIALIIVWATTQGLGRLGDPAIAFEARVFAARMSLALVAFCAIVLTSLLTERRDAEERITFLMGEVNHRAKNLLAVVQAVAFHSVESGGGSGDKFLERFRDRVGGLAASHDLLMCSGSSGADVEALVRSQLAHFESLFGERIVFSGPRVGLTPAATQTIGMALHELATNASKYGALANSNGRVEISWSDGADFNMRWVESGGSRVAVPSRSGFGRGVLVDMARHQLRGRARLDYAPEGLLWEFFAPRAQVINFGGDHGGR